MNEIQRKKERENESINCHYVHNLELNIDRNLNNLHVANVLICKKIIIIVPVIIIIITMRIYLFCNNAN